MKPWHEELFANFARACDREVFTQGTLPAVSFIEAGIEAANRSVRILDVGCGTGRHAIHRDLRAAASYNSKKSGAAWRPLRLDSRAAIYRANRKNIGPADLGTV